MNPIDKSTVAVMQEGDLRALLLEVGLDPEVDVASCGDSLEVLGLDSLAILEVATRIKDRFGADLDQEAMPGLTPAHLRELVNSLVAAAV